MVSYWDPDEVSITYLDASCILIDVCNERNLGPSKV